MEHSVVEQHLLEIQDAFADGRLFRFASVWDDPLVSTEHDGRWRQTLSPVDIDELNHLRSDVVACFEARDEAWLSLFALTAASTGLNAMDGLGALDGILRATELRWLAAESQSPLERARVGESRSGDAASLISILFAARQHLSTLVRAQHAMAINLDELRALRDRAEDE